jgi:hypothetical protein
MGFIEKAEETSKRARGEIVARLIVDADRRKILFVPDSINHPEFLEIRLGKTIEELKQQPDLVSPFIGVAVKIEGNTATEILVGISGIETYFGRFKSPLHTKGQVNKARDLVLATLQAEQILAKGFKLRVIYK